MQRRTSRAGTPILRTRAVFPSLLCAIALLAGGFLPTHAAPTPQLVPVATGLDNPRHMHFGPDGALYVAEAGRGGGPNAPSFVGSDGSTQYYGPTGAVTEITPYGSARIVTGLPSAAAIDGGSATGPTDLSAGDGLYVLMGGLTPSTRATLAATEPPAQDFDDLLLILSPDNDRYWIPFADCAAFEQANNPDGLEFNSDPYGLFKLGGRDANPFRPHFLVSDAGANDLIQVHPSGTVTLDTIFPDRLVPFGGSQIPMEAVPTCVVVGPQGETYVSQLTGFPFPVGGANIYRVRPGEPPHVVIGGFTNIVSMAFAPDGALYVVDIDGNGLASPTGPGNGALYRVNLDGATPTKTLLLSDGLVFPTAVAVSDRGAVFISNYGIMAGAGEVDRVVFSGS